MKTTALFISFVASTAMAFQPPTKIRSVDTQLLAQKSKQSFMEQLLTNLANNFEPIHGHGSLENDLAEQWQAQQEILQKRRSAHLDKAHLKQKYADPSKVKFDGKVGDSQHSSFGDNLSP